MKKDNIEIKIREHKQTDIQYRLKWLNNPKANKYIGDRMGQKTTLNEQKEWFKKYNKDKNKIFFTICAGNLPIGFMGFSNISESNRNADIFIMIGENNYRGRGFGAASLKWLVQYGFNKLKLHKINLGVTEINKPAVTLYKKFGFKIEGKMKDEIFYKGKYFNHLSMAIFNFE